MKKDNTVYNFYHPEHGRVPTTRHKLGESYGVNVTTLGEVINRKRLAVKGWRVLRENYVTINDAVLEHIDEDWYTPNRLRALPIIDKLVRPLYESFTGLDAYYLGDYYSYDKSWSRFLVACVHRYWKDNNMGD